MRRSILYGVTGVLIGAAVATAVGGSLAIGWLVLEDLGRLYELPNRTAVEYSLAAADLGLVVAIIVWSVICGVRIARRSDALPSTSRKEILAASSWWIIVLIPALIVGVGLTLEDRKEKREQQAIELAKQIAHRYNRITETQARFTSNGESIVLDLAFDGSRAGLYDVTAYAHDCGKGTLEIKQTLQLPAGKSRQSLTFPGTGDWKHGTSRYGPEVHVWDEQVVGRISLEPQVSADDAEALRRVGYQKVPWWMGEIDYRAPTLKVRCTDEKASAAPPTK